MAAEDVQNIIRAIANAQQNRVERQRLEQQATYQQAETDARNQQIQLEHQRLDQQQKQFDITAKAASAMHAAEIMRKKQEIAGGLLQGQPIPGDTLKSTRVDEQGNKFETHTIPDVGDVEIPAHETYLKQHIADLNATQGPDSPAARAKMAESEAAKADDLKRFTLTKTMDDQRTREVQAAEDHRSELMRQTQLQVARIHADATRANQYPALDPETAKQYVQGMADGTYTRDDILKNVPDKKQAMGLIGSVVAAGAKPLNDKQKSILDDFNTIKDIPNKVNLFNQILADHPVAARTPGTQEYKTLERIKGELDLVLPNVGRVVAGDRGRMSNQQIKYAEGGFMPSTNILSGGVKQNAERIADFQDVMTQALDSKLADLPPKQRAIIKQKFNLLPTAPAPAAAPATSQPKAIHYDTQGNVIPGGGQE